MYNNFWTVDGRLITLPVPATDDFYSNRLRYCGKCHHPKQKLHVENNITYSNCFDDIPCACEKYRVETYQSKYEYTNTEPSNWLIDTLVMRNLENNTPESGEHIEPQSGFRFCNNCHTSREKYLYSADKTVITFPNTPEYGELAGQVIKLRVECKCQSEEIFKKSVILRYKERQERLRSIRERSIKDPRYTTYTFEKDDNSIPELSKFCKQYVDNFLDIYRNNYGVLFYGNVGSGKTFAACTIANGIIDKYETSVKITNFPEILRKLTDFKDELRKEFIESFNRYMLVIIDDLGVERTTTFAAEQIYAIIDGRIRSGKPLIITTNNSPDEMLNSQSVENQRIFSRIIEMCVPFPVLSPNRRLKIAADKMQGLNALFAGGKV